jgi:ABC-2 type transport system permease protein
MYQRILSLILKELEGVWRDYKVRFSLLAPPVIQLLVFTFAATLDVKDVPIGIFNKDTGESSYELIQRFVGSPPFSKIHFISSEEEVISYIDNQKGLMVISIQDDFSTLLNQQNTASIQLILDGRRSNSAQITAGYASSIIANFSNELAPEPSSQPILVSRNWFNPNLQYYWYNIPSLVTTLSMLTCLIVTSISVARERELGTLDQLLVSPLKPTEIVIGKIIPGILIGFLESLVLIFVGIFIFGVPFRGSILLLFLSILVFVSSIGGIGLFISSLCQTQYQAMLGVFTFIVPSILLSGFATPIENMPVWLQPITYFIPMRYMLILSKGLFLKAIPLSVALKNLWQMVLIALFMLVGAGLFFKRRLE